MKTVIITGVTGGIGAATARHFERNGWAVIGTSRAPGSDWPLDVTSGASCTDLVREALARFGRVDALFNNAGFAQMGGFEDFSLADHRSILEVNLFGAMQMTAAVIPAMRRAGEGRIVNMGSVVSFLPAPFMGSYAASKHALAGFSTSLDHELRGSGLRSVLVRAGFMRSRIAANTVRAEDASDVSAGARVAVERRVEAALQAADDPEIVARAVFRACADAAPPAVIDAGREAKSLARLSGLVPARLFEASFRRRFGLPA